MRLEDLNWMDVAHYLQRDDRIILVTGATEQHAYLSLLTDILIPSRLALALAEREHVLVAPPINFGYSRYFAAFPGTISLTRNTFELVLLEIIECLLHQGFRGFLVMNGHGGNALPERLHDFLEDDTVRVAWFDWWRGQAVKDFEAAHGYKLRHANWGENFPFNRVAESPAGHKPPFEGLLEDNEIYTNRERLGDGSYGGPYQVDDALMQALFGAVVDEAAALLRAL